MRAVCNFSLAAFCSQDDSLGQAFFTNQEFQSNFGFVFSP